MNENEKLFFINALDRLAGIAHQIAVDKGWWESDRNDGELIALMHSECRGCHVQYHVFLKFISIAKCAHAGIEVSNEKR